MDFKNYYIVAACLLGCSIILNSYGIKLLYSRRRLIKTQGLLLMNLSFTEIAGAALWLMRDTVIVIKRSPAALKAFAVLMIFLINVRLIWYLSMFSILLDRFFACNFPIKHMTVVTKYKAKVALTVIWLVFMTSAVLFSILDVKYFKMVFTRELFLALAGLFVLLFFVTYASILYRLRQSRPHSNRQRQNQNSQFMRVTVLIFLTFIVFEIVPSIIGYVNTGPLPNSDFLHATALLTDPIVYILFQRDMTSAAPKNTSSSPGQRDRAHANATPSSKRSRKLMWRRNQPSMHQGRGKDSKGACPASKMENQLMSDSGISDACACSTFQDRDESIDLSADESKGIEGSLASELGESCQERIEPTASKTGVLNPTFEGNDEEKITEGPGIKVCSRQPHPENKLLATVQVNRPLNRGNGRAAFTVNSPSKMKPGALPQRNTVATVQQSEENATSIGQKTSGVCSSVNTGKGRRRRDRYMLLRWLQVWRDHQSVELPSSEDAVDMSQGKYHFFSSQESTDSCPSMLEYRSRANTEETIASVEDN